jgi:glycosyltransferase involved in cell wall biosynthesis
MMRRRHLLHLIDTMNPAAGGPSEAVRALFAYAPAAYTGEVVSLDEPGAVFLKGYPFPIHALGSGRTRLSYSPRLGQWLAENRHRFDGILVNGLWRYVSFAAWRASLHGTPYIVFIHGMLDPYFKRRYPLKHLQKWVYWLLSEYWVLRAARRVLFTTEEECRLARSSFWLHRWTALVLPLGAGRPHAAEVLLTAAFQAHSPALRGQRFLLFLGRIHPKKGCDLLLASFLRLAATDPDLHLVLAGPDDHNWASELQQPILAAGLEDRVHWTGMLTGDVKWGAFYASEAFILPSHQENFGIAVAEALACGRPVLLTDRINIAPEIARDGAGLMEPDTPGGIDRLLSRWIATQPEARRSMGKRALETFNLRYDMEQNAPRILALFDHLSPEREP